MAWGFDDPSDEISRVQALRADPPGLARGGGRRTRVFGAAIQQFSELLAAANAAGPASSPILLFYALSQAGRAVAASHQPGGGRWEFSSHGLKIIEDDRVGETMVRPEPRNDRGDAFSVVSDVTGSPALQTGVSLKQLWTSLPSLQAPPGLGGDARPLVLEPGPFVGISFTQWYERKSAVVRLPAAIGDHAQAATYLASYPAAVSSVSSVVVTAPGAEESPWRQYRVEFTEPILTVGESYLSPLTFYLRPSVETGNAPPRAFMTWWATLLALASLARYRPGAWVGALDKDRSPLAIPLEDGLRKARQLLPRLVLHALTGRWT